MSRATVRFLRRGEVVELTDVDPNETLLDYLRLREGARGTKEGCAEGDCGACTVALGTIRGERVVYEPVNSCIQLLGMVDGKEVVAVDDLASSTTGLHPVQQAMVDHHGSQCGFCTPGLVMSLFTLYHCGTRPARAQINDWLAGNLCRCTGYRPIVDAAVQSCTGLADDLYASRSDQTLAKMLQLNDGADLFVGDSRRFLHHPPRWIRWPSFMSVIPTPIWLPVPPMLAYGSPSSCVICRVSSGWEGWPVSMSSTKTRPKLSSDPNCHRWGRPTRRPKRGCRRLIRTWVRSSGVSVRSKCARPERWEEMSPMARPSATARRC